MYFVRHGQSVANLQGVLAGSTDYPLSRTGLEQAVSIANFISGELRPSLVLSSPLVRASKTAEIIAERTGLKEYVTLGSVAAAAAGDLEGLPYEEWYKIPEHELASHGAEDAKMLYSRAAVAIGEITDFHANMEDGDTIIVSHAGVYQMLVGYMRRLYPETLMYDLEKPANGELVKIDFTAE